ncbi:MAG: GtrA family protein [Alphaproteobacteria bacterium]|nr:GtrA family protein [Alphaproteobacteria bacterium]
MSGTDERGTGGRGTALLHPETLASLVRFGLVGVGATLVHACVGLGLEKGLGQPALGANLLGFFSGFIVSYLGHYTFSFRSSAAHGTALPRFFAIAMVGLGLNQAIVYGMVNRMGLDYALALAVIVVSVPALTFLLARSFAFGPRREP